MSSKEQLKEALRRRDQDIRKLKQQVGILNTSLGKAEAAMKAMTSAMAIAKAVRKKEKKWYQFWK